MEKSLEDFKKNIVNSLQDIVQDDDAILLVSKDLECRLFSAKNIDLSMSIDDLPENMKLLIRTAAMIEHLKSAKNVTSNLLDELDDDVVDEQ